MLRRRSLSIVLASLAIAACSDSSGPKPVLVAGSMDIVAGNGQTDTVTKLLPNPIEVQVTTDPASPSGLRMSLAGSGATGEPVPGQLVNFVVADPACGRPFAGSATTNAEGIAKERWELGTVAKACEMEARAVDQVTGEPIVFSTATATALPGAVTEASIVPRAAVFLNGTLDASTLVQAAWDEYQNAVTDLDVTVTVSDAAWTVQGETITAGPDEASGELTLTVGSVTSTIPLVTAVDLRTKTWDAEFFCGPLTGVSNDAGVYIDSMAFAVTVDSVVYISPSIGAGAIWYGGSVTRWMRDETSDVVPVVDAHEDLRGQAPGELHYRRWNSNVPEMGLGVRTETAPETYVGGTWCQYGGSSSWRPMTLRARP